ncbi:MAG TPA: hypothetical protein VFE12_02565 [Acetobacteraceae bacterium]|jgi:hypothetical protein|nr:hypothetical protein [Acetobacteraceae bacterium]
MSTPHTAEYFRKRRKLLAQRAGRPIRGDYTQSPEALKRGAELRRLEQLPLLAWPAHLFRNVKGIGRTA